ncbi:hypothetical protein EMCRGX_G016154 [Ephydatia muelleri]
MSNRRDYCCDPFKNHKHRIYLNLRVLSTKLIEEHPSLSLKCGDVVCCNCLTAITRTVDTSASSTIVSDECAGPSNLALTTDIAPTASIRDTESYSEGSDDGDQLDDTTTQLHKINETFSIQGISPIKKRRMHSETYLIQKVRTFDVAMERNLQLCTGVNTHVLHTNDGTEIIQQLKEKFGSTKSRSERIRILTALPKSWSVCRITEEFGAKDTVELVKSFYCSDSISRVMPGKKDFLSVRKADGEKEHRQKRLVLCNLKEAYHQFKTEHPDVKVGFSKFAELRPKECVLAGATGTHSVCVCAIHQNVKLMMAGGRLESLTNGWYTHYTDCLAAIQCEPSTYNCAIGTCTDCSGTGALREELEAIMEDNGVETVQYNQWINTDRANLETRIAPVEEFLDAFMVALEKLKLHDYIAKNQAKFVAEKKERLNPGEFIVIADFSENYSFVVQDEVQSFHWNKLQATIHPFLCCYKNSDGKLDSVCFTIISENTDHDIIAVHLFQRKLVSFLSDHFGAIPKKIIYISDGCAGQYKNCYNFTNLCHHEKDFGIPAEWHFFATSHGKLAADGIAGTEHKDEADFLAERFKYSRTVPGTRSFHSFISISISSVEVRPYSLGTMKRTERVTSAHVPEPVPLSAIKSYVTVAYGGDCWLGYVTKVDMESRSVEVNFLHPQLPAKSYIYPRHQDILDVDPTDILTLVSPTTGTGRSYTLTSKEVSEAKRALEARLSAV